FTSLYVVCDTSHLVLHTFPTRALPICRGAAPRGPASVGGQGRGPGSAPPARGRRLDGRRRRRGHPGGGARRLARAGTARPQPSRDRKSTRLNSSHVKISYAVFCLKKKK